MEKINVQIPVGVKHILTMLEDAHHSAYVVGGAVRDMLLKKQPKDWDICTSALPNEVKQIFDKTIDTGLKHGTVTVMIDNIGYEVTTFRVDGQYSDGRHPDDVKFTRSLKEDLSRRDFTINAMAVDASGKLYDYFNGRKHLKDEMIVCVGNPIDRFNEDGLRRIRAIRFACQCGFHIVESTYNMIEGDISHISKERLRDELNKILVSNNPSDGIYDLHNARMLKYFGMDELDKCFGFKQHNEHHDRDVADHTLYALSNSENDLLLRLAILLHDIGKPTVFELKDGRGTFYAHHKVSADITREIMELLRYSNKEIDIVNKLVYNHMCRYYKYTNKSIKKLINRVGSDNLGRLYKLMICDRLATKPPYDFEDIYMLKFKCDKFLSEKQPLSIKDLAIGGNDLMNIGFRQGKEIGVVLNSLLELVLEDEKNNDKTFLLAKASELKSEF